MESDYISRQAAIRIACDDECEDCPDGGCDMYRRLKRLPAADVVSRECFNRILAENDTMREMLAQIGKKPGDKMDDVRSVVRGEWERPKGSTPRSWIFVCSKCGDRAYFPVPKYFPKGCGYNFCPNCGADMRPKPETEN